MHMQAAFTQTDGGVQAGKATETNFKPGKRSARPKGPVLFRKQRMQFGIHRLQRSRTWPDRKLRSAFLFFLLLLLLFGKILGLIRKHLGGSVMRSLVRVERTLARKIIPSVGYRLVHHRGPLGGLFDNLFEHLAQISMLLIKGVHVVLQLIGKPRE